MCHEKMNDTHKYTVEKIEIIICMFQRKKKNDINKLKYKYTHILL